ncbi:DUF1684 domain-containing protein [Arthrobacter sp. GMC3]|uniref:DUF1684 domain-containing protein n=1 Tax=Arthrobacter sp. GMC3 TaxID=2058894 RepID=UPI000CE3D5B8|nr:DUF1684 domain-containing protein [Arthrobacter sp. GMC3]
MTTTEALAAADVADWRLQTFELYAQVRRTARDDSPAAAHVLWVQGRDELFVTHPASALSAAAKANFTGLPVAAYNPDFRFECVPSTEGAGQEMLVQTGTDGTVPFEQLGTLDVPGIGALALWQLRSYGGGIFLPFRDASSGADGGSYGGGRYLLDTIKGANLGRSGGAFILDFNFAYNPSCAYDEAWACPLPGPSNRLAARIPVGEMY